MVRSPDSGRLLGITCAHVANVALERTDPYDPARPGPEARVACELPFADGQKAAGIVVAWFPPVADAALRDHPMHDIAVLQLEPPPRGVEPLRLATRTTERLGQQTPFESFGFMRGPNGVDYAGTLTGPDAGQWLDATANAQEGLFLQEGASGSPLVQSRGTEVVGMAVWRFEKAARQGKAIPPLALAAAWPPLAMPYVDFDRFDEATAHLFFGRSAEIAELDALLQRRLVPVFGASGAGKSSLVRAGLIPAWRARGWLPLIFRPIGDNEPAMTNFARALEVARAAVTQPPPPRDVPTIAGHLQAQSLTIEAEIAELLRLSGAAGVLIVIDQFEEFLRGGAAATQEALHERETMLAAILAMCGAPFARVACVVTMRSDVLADVPNQPDLARFLQARPLWLGAPRESGIAEAISRPAALFGVTVDPALAIGLARQVIGDSMQAAPGLDAGRLPLLQATLVALWRTALQQDGAGNWTLGGPTPAIEAAVAARADAAVAGFDSALLNSTLALLVAPAGVREPDRLASRVVSREEAGPERWGVLTRLADAARLVRLSGSGRGQDAPHTASAQLVHEALIGAWERLRVVAIDETGSGFLEFRERLERDIEQWERRGRVADWLLRSPALEVAMDWRARRALAREQVAFINKSERVRGEERTKALNDAKAEARRERWLRRAAVAFAATAILALLGGVFVLKQARLQEVATLRAQSLTLALQSRDALRRGDKELAYLIAAQAASWKGAGAVEQRPRVIEADRALEMAARLLTAASLPGQGEVAVSPTGRTLAIHRQDTDMIVGLQFDPKELRFRETGPEIYRLEISSEPVKPDFETVITYDDVIIAKDAWQPVNDPDQRSNYACGSLFVIGVTDHGVRLAPNPYGKADVDDVVEKAIIVLRADVPPCLLSVSEDHRQFVTADSEGRLVWFWDDGKLDARTLPYDRYQVSDVQYQLDTRRLLLRVQIAGTEDWRLITADPGGSGSVASASLENADQMRFLGPNWLIRLRSRAVGIAGLPNGQAPPKWSERQSQRPIISFQTNDGPYAVFTTTDEYQLYGLCKGTLRLIKLPPVVRADNASRITLFGDLGIAYVTVDNNETNRLSHFVAILGSPCQDEAKMVDMDLMLSRIGMVEESTSIIPPAGVGGMQFVTSGDGGIVFWSRSATAVFTPIQLTPYPGEADIISPQTSGLPTSSGRSIVIFSTNSLGDHVVELSDTDITASRDTPAGPVSRTERTLTHCLSAAEAAQLGRPAATASPALERDRSVNRHACPSFLLQDYQSLPWYGRWARWLEVNLPLGVEAGWTETAT
jgi:hypothetical protein